MDVEMRILRQQVEDLGGAAHTNELHGAAGGRAAIETAVAAGLLERPAPGFLLRRVTGGAGLRGVSSAGAAGSGGVADSWGAASAAPGAPTDSSGRVVAAVVVGRGAGPAAGSGGGATVNQDRKSVV